MLAVIHFQYITLLIQRFSVRHVSRCSCRHVYLKSRKVDQKNINHMYISQIYHIWNMHISNIVRHHGFDQVFKKSSPKFCLRLLTWTRRNQLYFILISQNKECIFNVHHKGRCQNQTGRKNLKYNLSINFLHLKFLNADSSICWQEESGFYWSQTQVI